MRFRSLILSILPPSDQLQEFTLSACESDAHHYYYTITTTCIILLLLLLHRSPSPRLLLNDRARTPESFYPRCVIAAHNHYRVESSLERNKCALDRSRRILCERTVVASAVGSEVHDGQNEPVTFQVNIGGVS